VKVLKMNLLPYAFSFCQIEAASKVDLTQDYTFVSKTDEELSLICPTSSKPETVLKAENGWCCLKITEKLDFSLVGIIATVTKLLAEERVSVSVVSTYNTAYFFIKQDKLGVAMQTLGKNGFEIG
jgi:hypothetical protein